ncbi:hypothetical protein [Streptomyces sp. NPDC001415]
MMRRGGLLMVVLAALVTGCGGLPSDAGPGGDPHHPNRPVGSPRDDVLVHISRLTPGGTTGREIEVLKDGLYDAGTSSVSGMDPTSGGHMSPADLDRLRQALDALDTAVPPSSSPLEVQSPDGPALYVIAYKGRFITTRQTDKPALVQRDFAAVPPGLEHDASAP